MSVIHFIRKNGSVNAHFLKIYYFLFEIKVVKYKK